MNLKSLFILFSLGLYHLSFGQCDFPMNLPIADDSTVTYTISISGAVQNNLAMNGVCGVDIRFRHTVVGDIRISLVSPSGQVVTLVGPGVELSNRTDFTTWNISFVPCSSPANPDLGFSPIFNGMSQWGQLSSYNGVYYPQMGCLEDIDFGSVNGTWELVVSDVALFDIGLIESVSLIFCNDEGILCESCDARKRQLLNADVTFCQGDPQLDIAPLLNTQVGSNDTSIFKNYYVVVDTVSDRVVGYQTDMDFRLADVGVYEVCYLNIDQSDFAQLPQVGTSTSPIPYVDQINSIGLCAALSQNCMLVTVVEPNSVDTLSFTLCEGDSLTIFGVTYNTAGRFSFSKNQGGLCDSLYIIDINTPQPSGNFNPLAPTLACTGGGSSISYNVTGGAASNFSWTTQDGSILSGSNTNMIMVDSIGSYQVSYAIGSCIFFDTVEVTYNSELPVISLRADSIDCNKAAATITFSSSTGIATSTWSPTVLAAGLTTAKVDSAGIYTIFVTDANGCKGSNSINVVDNKLAPVLDITSTSVTCAIPTASINVNGLNAQISHKWVNPSDFDSLDVTFETTVPATYVLSAINLINGCESLDTINVMDDRYTLIFTVPDVVLNCNSSTISLTPLGLNGIAPYTYQWNSSTSQVSTGPTYTVRDSGQYTLTIQDANGCAGIDTFRVSEDFQVPIVQARDTVFTCINDSILLSVDNLDLSNTYVWEGPFMLDTTAPQIYIKHHGDYFVTVTLPNGCFGIKQITVAEGIDLPKSAFSVDAFTCFDSEVSIAPSRTVGFDFEWNGSGLVSGINQDTAILTLPGYYTVTITELSTNCNNSYEFVVEDLRDNVVAETIVDELNCVNDEVTPIFVTMDVIRESVWYNKSGDLISNVLPTLTVPDTYYVDIISPLGCVTKDTIEVVLNAQLPTVIPTLTDIICEPDSALQMVTSDIGVFFEWIAPDASLKIGPSVYVREGGAYNIKVTGNNGCKDSIQVNIQVDTIPETLLITPDGSVACDDTLITISSGSLRSDWTYLWSGNNIVADRTNEIDIISGGNYSLLITDLRGCESVSSIDVDDLRVFPSFALSSNNITCEGIAQASISMAQNVDSVRWIGPLGSIVNQDTVNIMLPGNYQVFGYSILGCEFDTSFTVLIDTLKPQITNIISGIINCDNQVIDIGFEASNGISSIIWTGATNQVLDTSILSISTPGTYQAQIIGNNGCMVNQSIDVIIDTITSSARINGGILTCLQSKLRLTLDDTSNIRTVTWSGSGPAQIGLEAFINQRGRYTAEIVTRNGCRSISEIEITDDFSQPILSLADTFYLPCNGDPIALSIDSDIPLELFRWFSPTFYSEEASPSVGDTMHIRVFAAGANGCNSLDSAVIVFDTRPIDYDYESDSVSCYTPFATLRALRVADDESFYWRLPDGTTRNDLAVISSNQGGVHYLVVNRGNNCLDSTAFSLVFDTISPQPYIIYDDVLQCDKQTAELTGDLLNGNRTYSFTWNTSNGSIVGGSTMKDIVIGSPGTYQFNVVDLTNGCRANTNIDIIEESNSLTEILFAFDIPSCFGGDNGYINILGTVGNNGSVNYAINNNDIGDTRDIYNLSAGSYLIEVTDSFGCTTDTLIRLDDGLDYSVEVIGDTLIDLGDTINLEVKDDKGGLLYDEIIWTAEDEILCDTCTVLPVGPTQHTIYNVLTITPDGCEAEAMLLVRVNKVFDLEFPNVFSANAVDEANRFYKLPELKEIDEVILFRIHDRWGSIMYEKKNYKVGDETGWNGTLNGEYALPGVYIIEAEVRLKNGDKMSKVADLTFLRD